MTAPLAFLDLETTGLDHQRHQIFDVAIITADPYDDGSGYKLTEHQWYIKPDIAQADPNALRLTKFYERTAEHETVILDYGWNLYEPTHEVLSPVWCPPVKVAQQVALLTAGRHIVGACPWFDVGFLVPFLAEHGLVGAWDYHLIDTETLMVGALTSNSGELGLLPPTLPWKSNDLSVAVGVNPDDFDRHTALGDARWALACYAAVMGDQGQIRRMGKM